MTDIVITEFMDERSVVRLKRDFEVRYVLTPHIAGVTVESNARGGDMIANGIASYLRGGAGQ